MAVEIKVEGLGPFVEKASSLKGQLHDILAKSMAKELDDKIMAVLNHPYQYFDPAPKKAMPEGVIDYEVHFNHMYLQYEFRFVTSVGSIVKFKGPKEQFDKHGHPTPTELASIFEYALTYGEVEPMAQELKELVGMGGQVMQQVVGKPSGNAYKVLLGGPRNGEAVTSNHNPLKVPVMDLPLSYPFPAHACETASVQEELYFMEYVAVGINGLKHQAEVYRHESVPVEATFDIFMAALEEFPILRAIPLYNIIWRAQ